MNKKVDCRRWVYLTLFQAQKDHATEVVIAPAEGETTPIRHKISGKWHDMAPPPENLRPHLLSALGRLAKLVEGPFPKKRVIDLLSELKRAAKETDNPFPKKWLAEIASANAPSKWRVRATAAEAKWRLTPCAR